MRRPLWFVLVAAGVSHPAWGLSQFSHLEISRNVCTVELNTWGFCEAVGTSAHNVDGFEWSDPAAHAQLPETGTTCAGAQSTVDRADVLGRAIRGELLALKAAVEADQGGAASSHRLALAQTVGRLLHTLQDHCAHRGLPNTQHAWASDSDVCRGTSLSPDVQPEAVRCAEHATSRFFSALKSRLTELQLSPASLQGVSGALGLTWPTRQETCEFIESASAWDGQDRGWDQQKVTAVLDAQLATALSGASGVADVCADGPASVDLPAPAPPVDVSGGRASCAELVAFCSERLSDLVPAPFERTTRAIGCAHAGAGLPLGAVGLAIVLAWVRRRR